MWHHRLQIRFDTDIVANFGEKISSKVADFIVPKCGESALCTGESMLHGHPVTTIAFVGDFRWGPTIAQDHGVMECRLVQGEAMFSEGKNSEPGRGTLFSGKMHSSLQWGRQVVIEVELAIRTRTRVQPANEMFYFFFSACARIYKVKGKMLHPK